MPKNLKRYCGNGDLHFVTFSCYRRLPLLGSNHARNVFVEALSAIRARYGFLLVGYVVMPEHVHLLLSETAGGTTSDVLKVLKQRVSRDLRKESRAGQTKLLLERNGEGLDRFWLPRFYDFNTWSAGKIREKLDYMHFNPVSRGLVKVPSEWVWSSFLFYETGEKGLVPIDVVG
jgi:putative transposase